MGCIHASQPQSVNYGTQLSGTLNAQQGVAPQQLAMEQQYQPQYANLALQNYNTVTAGTQANAASGLPAAANTIRSMDPQSQALLGQLNSQAMTGLQAGQTLTPEEQRMVTQNSRAASAARGISNTNQGIGDELLQNYNLGRTVQQQRQQFAGSVLGMNQQMVDNPALQLYGQGSQTGTQILGQAGPSLFNPESNLSAQITSGNQAADQFWKYNNVAGGNMGQAMSSY